MRPRSYSRGLRNRKTYANANANVNVCPPPAETHAFRRLRKSLIALLIVVCSKSSQICCSAFLAPEWSWALSKVCEMPEALHPTHDSQVG